VSNEILERTSEAYRRIRNTFRFLLSNLADYEPEMAVPWDDMPELDRHALVTLADVAERVTRSYDDWKFHQVYHTVYGYCVTELSSFYLDVIKDRLYADAAGSLNRRSAQTVLAEVLVTLVRLVAPILSFTTEEIWQYLPSQLREGVESVQLAGWPALEVPAEEAAQLRSAYAVVLDVREVATKALEDARNAGTIGKSQEARIVVTAPRQVIEALSARGFDSLAEMLIVSAVTAEEGAELAIAVLPADGEKCPRCWNFRTLGTDEKHPGVCARCAGVLKVLG
jgi:isoleucyl-tRNA synthetase